MDALMTLVTDPDSSEIFWRLTVPGVAMIAAGLIWLWTSVRRDQRKADEQLRAAIGGK